MTKVNQRQFLPRLPQPLAPKRTKADSPLLAQRMVTMLRNSMVMARRTMGQTHVMAYPESERSPRCNPVDDDKFYLVDDATLAGVPFANNKAEFEVPWYVSKGFDTIGANLCLKTNIVGPFSVLMKTGTLVDSATAASSNPTAVVKPQTSAFSVQDDSNPPLDIPPWKHANVDVFLKPTLPESREVAITFELKFLQSDTENGIYSLGNYNLYVAIQSLMIWDEPVTGEL